MQKYSETAPKATAPVAGGINIQFSTSSVATRKCRRVSRETWASLRAAISHQHESLPPDSPRVRPTLPRLRWMEAPR
jgi:hypothetical protein